MGLLLQRQKEEKKRAMEEEIAREKAAAEEKRRSRQQRHQQHDQPFRARRGSIDTHWQQPASSSAQQAKAAREAKEAADAKAAAEAVEVARRAEEEEAAQEAARAVAVAEAEVRHSDTTVAPSFGSDPTPSVGPQEAKETAALAHQQASADSLAIIRNLAQEEVSKVGSKGIPLSMLHNRMASMYGFGDSTPAEELHQALKTAPDVTVSEREGEPWFFPRVIAVAGESQIRTLMPSQARHYARDTTTYSKDELPPGWEKRTAGDGRTYYANVVSRTTQWEKPTFLD